MQIAVWRRSQSKIKVNYMLKDSVGEGLDERGNQDRSWRVNK